MPELQLDDQGWPVLFADVPNAGGVSLRKTGSQGGNTAHDSGSGKFTRKPQTREELRQEVAPTSDPLEFKRMLDAARDAAREFDFPDEGDILEFLQGRAANPAQVDVQGFLKRVEEQRLNDLTDIFHQQLRKTSEGLGKRRIKVSAPRGFVKRATSQLRPEQIDEMTSRLTARGHTPEDVAKFFASRRPAG